MTSKENGTSESFISGAKINLWVAPTDTSSLVQTPESFFFMLGEREQEKYRKLQLDNDKRSYLASRVLLRTALSKTVRDQIPPELWLFEDGTHGKPAIAKTQLTSLPVPAPCFSLSHARHLVVVAICPNLLGSFDSAIGVDVEPFNISTSRFSIDAALTKSEKKTLESLSIRARAAETVKLWTAKEAYAKMIGQGVSLDFTTFEIALDPTHLVRSANHAVDPDNVFFCSRMLHFRHTTYFLTLAMYRPPGPDPVIVEHILDDPYVRDHSRTDAMEGDEHGRMATTYT